MTELLLCASVHLSKLLSYAVILFMWQDDITGAAQYIDACLKRVCISAGPPVGDQALISPELAGKDAMIISFSLRGRPLGILSQDRHSHCQGTLLLLVMLHVAGSIVPGAGLWGSEAGG